MRLIFDTIIPFIINNIGIIISILAFILSIFNFIYLIVTNKKNLKFNIENYSYGNVDGKRFYFFNIVFSNNSRQPISVNQIDLLHNNKKALFQTGLSNRITAVLPHPIMRKQTFHAYGLPFLSPKFHKPLSKSLVLFPLWKVCCLYQVLRITPSNFECVLCILLLLSY